jgi:hypothetical protein
VNQELDFAAQGFDELPGAVHIEAQHIHDDFGAKIAHRLAERPGFLGRFTV